MTATKPCDHRWNKHGRCTCGAQQCGEAIHWTRGGGPCAQPRPCRYHAPLTTAAKVAITLLACLVLV